MNTVLAGDPTAKLPNGAARPKRILVVDDEPLILDLLVRTKNIENCDIVLARDGEEAWEKLQTAQYDCIILDMKMPRVTGLELYHALGKIDPVTAYKIIFITGETDDPEIVRFVTNDPNTVFFKPFDTDDMWSEVKRVLEEA